MFMGLLAKRVPLLGRWSVNAGSAAREAFLPFAIGSEPSQRSAPTSYYPLQTSRNLKNAHSLHKSMRETMTKRIKKKYLIAEPQPNAPPTMMNHLVHPVHLPQSCCGGRMDPLKATATIRHRQ
jgi:hypothetical protein